MTHHALGALTEPSDTDRTKALVTATHMSRELLSLAERISDSATSRDFTAAQRYIATALTYLQTVLALLPTHGGTDNKCPTTGVRNALLRTVAASEAALGHAKLAESYATMTAEQVSAFEAQQVARTRSHWHRATEAARQEAHRALAGVVDMFPEACDFTGEV